MNEVLWGSQVRADRYIIIIIIIIILWSAALTFSPPPCFFFLSLPQFTILEDIIISIRYFVYI